MFHSRDWRAWWWGYLTHWLQGAAVAILIPTMPWAAVCLLTLLLSYQWAGWVKYDDTVKLDMFDLLAGFVVGLLGVIVWTLAGTPVLW